MSELPIPMTVDEFTSEWLTSALRAGGVLEDERVTDVEASPLSENFGFLGSLTRLTRVSRAPSAPA